MKGRGITRTVLVLMLAGAFLSAQQAAAESVFTARGTAAFEKLQMKPLPLAASPMESLSRSLLSAPADTVETSDVIVEEEHGPGLGKEIAMFAIIGAVVGLAAYELIKSDDTGTKKSSGGGKEVPISSRGILLSVPLSR